MLNIIVLVIGVLLLIGGIGAIGAKANESKKFSKVLIMSGIAIMLISQCFVAIKTGYTGVRVTFGQVDEKNVPQGLNFKIPFVQKIETINNKQQDTKLATKNSIEATIAGKVPITISNVTVTYQINSNKAAYLYTNVNDPESLITYDIVSSSIKATTPDYDTDKVVVRSVVEASVKETLQQYINDKYGPEVIDILQITIGNIEFTDEYNKSVNAKNVAKQEAETQEIVNQKNIDQANAEAESKLIEAQAEKEANELLEVSITDKILMQQYLENWDGKLPAVTGSDNLMLDVSGLMGSGE